MIVTILLGELVAEQIWYNSAQYLRQSYYIVK